MHLISYGVMIKISIISISVESLTCLNYTKTFSKYGQYI